MSTTFEETQIGDKVWSASHGNGVVYSLLTPPEYNGPYPIEVLFDTNPDISVSYTVLGQEVIDQNRVLFWQETKAPEHLPRTRLINGIEVPNVHFRLELYRYYYYPSLDLIIRDRTFLIEGDKTNESSAVDGLCYPYMPENKEAAMSYTKTLLRTKE
jgi:hypothetical protein